MLWAGLITAPVAASAALAVDRGRDVDTLLGEWDGPRTELAELLGAATAGLGLFIPRQDHQLAAWLARDGIPVPVDAAGRGAVLALQDGRLGLAIGAGVLESAGESLAIVHAPEPGRYVHAWHLPGVTYMGGTTSAA